jgi:tetratricopeptide (TPR) repeat protein
VGLHLLLGLVSRARGDERAAEEAFARALSFEPAGHIYTRQACANTWLAIGAVRLRQSRPAEAAAAFDHRLERVPGHPLALAAMSVAGDDARRGRASAQLDVRLAQLRSYGASVEAAMAGAVAATLVGRHAEAADLVRSALQSAPAGTSTGWTLRVEPLLHVSAHPDEWDAALTLLRARAA